MGGILITLHFKRNILQIGITDKLLHAHVRRDITVINFTRRPEIVSYVPHILMMANN